MAIYNLHKESAKFEPKHIFYVPGVGRVDENFVPPIEGEEGFEAWQLFLEDMEKP